jgi:hypothetical protein
MKLGDGTETRSHEYLIVHSKNVPVFMQLEEHSWGLQQSAVRQQHNGIPRACIPRIIEQSICYRLISAVIYSLLCLANRAQSVNALIYSVPTISFISPRTDPVIRTKREKMFVWRVSSTCIYNLVSERRHNNSALLLHVTALMFLSQMASGDKATTERSCI